MTPLEELVARDYFERSGFFLRLLHAPPPVSASGASQKPGTKKFKRYPSYLLQRQTSREINEELGDRFQLFSSDLGGRSVAVFVFFSWSGTGLTVPVLQSGSRYRGWIRRVVVPGFQASMDGLTEDFSLHDQALKMILLPGLPGMEPFRQECIDLLKKAGVEAMLTFRTLLESLVYQILPESDSQHSSVSELLRLLKVYELFRSPQLDLFEDF